MIINYLAIIPARSGSKGLPNKNIKKIDGKTLIEITVNCANKIEKIDKIFFSTDSQEYINIYKNLNIDKDITFDYLRSKELSSDTASANEYIIDCLKYLKEKNIIVKNFIILQVTSPLRQVCDIEHALNEYENNNCTSLVSVYEPSSHPNNCFYLNNDNTYEWCGKMNLKRRQDYNKVMALNGSLYIKNTNEFEKNNTIITPFTKFYEMKKILSFDIDDEEDFYIIESLYFYLKMHGEI
jgi:CMP-N,N'-diacetyllegionaminic acid synthase